VVDRLLASPRFGERWAVPWLDEARYADSNGYQADQLRELWPYRDWVVKALNGDMPFDRFVTEQIAGDLLPGATLEQKIATGFHRTVTCNVEAGVNPEENRVNQVFDRVNTTATVFLGLSFECAQCHDHKYDPVSMSDYYRLFAYFNNTPLEVERPKGAGVQYELAGPMMALPGMTGKAGKPLTTLVMAELDQPRETHVLKRGNYQTPGPKVSVGTPESLHPLSKDQPPNRLGLARWLTSRDNPLLARVTVNRWWAELFGRGLVGTVEEFGSQGELPTHPELLDWLALEFMDSGWNMKHVLRLIATSATYAQSSKVPPLLQERDPDNRLLARGPRFRLRAEMIRDAALAASGLLSYKSGGPPVMPYQPAGLWKTVGRNAPVWTENTNEDRFRRGVYVIWRRAVPYPSFVTFDAPDRSSCVVKRSRTNTPLQALTLLNDPAYVEMALALAQRIELECPSVDDRDRARFAWQLALTRSPTSEETETLLTLFRAKRDDFTANPAKARELIAGIKGVPAATGLDAIRLAAWFHVANVLLNLDEAITKG
jgi:hypothetical protein